MNPMISAFVVMVSSLPAFGPPPRATIAPGQPAQLLLAPIFQRAAACVEHRAADGLLFAGDALGTDCMPIAAPGEDGVGFARLYRTDGKTNDDWYGWQAKVHSPVDGTVVGALINPVVNQPGSTGRPPATTMQIVMADGTMVTLAHLGTVTVKRGDVVSRGQRLGDVGNNGFGRAPHIHIGAWRGTQPLQIRWDLTAGVKD